MLGLDGWKLFYMYSSYTYDGTEVFKRIVGDIVVSRGFSILKFLNNIMNDKLYNFRKELKGDEKKVIYCIIEMTE